MLEYKPGYFAESLSGHDKGRIYMIVEEEGDYVDLCDGRRRRLTNPKHKKKKHIQMIRSEEAAESLSLWLAGSQPDEEIGRAVRAFERSRKESRR